MHFDLCVHVLRLHDNVIIWLQRDTAAKENAGSCSEALWMSEVRYRCATRRHCPSDGPKIQDELQV